MLKTCGVEVADIFRRYGPQYRKNHPLPVNQLRAMRAIEICRTATLGGHVDECDSCGHLEISYNSCRNRHCPKCQFLRKEQWIEARSEDLLPIQYFHAVFTIPAELNPLVLRNQKVMYNLLFRSASETLMELGDARLGVRLGFICILHTWGQNLMDHPHVHCVITGGGLSREGRWISCRKNFFIPVRVMSALFRGKFLSYLKESFGDLQFPGTISHLQEAGVFDGFRRQFYHKKWIVYCKAPFQGAAGALQYLGRYTHRIAISNHRIISVCDGTVSFRWRDYSDADKQKVMTVTTAEFIRRFLLHVLPQRFVKIRHYGLLANKTRKASLVLCRQLLGSPVATEVQSLTLRERLVAITGFDITKCPVCKTGDLHRIRSIEPLRCNGPPRWSADA